MDSYVLNKMKFVYCNVYSGNVCSQRYYGYWLIFGNTGLSVFYLLYGIFGDTTQLFVYIKELLVSAQIKSMMDVSIGD